MATRQFFENFKEEWIKEKEKYESKINSLSKESDELLKDKEDLSEEKTIEVVGYVAASLIETIKESLIDIIPSLFVEISNLMQENNLTQNSSFHDTKAFLKSQKVTRSQIDDFQKLVLFNNKFKHLSLNSNKKEKDLINEINPIEVLDKLAPVIQQLFTNNPRKKENFKENLKTLLI